jgi:putative transposase
MGLARSTFYDTPPVSVDGDELLARIRAICDEFECYGYRRVGAALRQQGVVVNGKKLRRLMRERGLQPKRRRRYVVTTDSDHTGPIYPDLAKDLVPDRPNQLWVADLTYVAVPGGSSTWRPCWMPGRARWSATRSADRWTPASPSRR